MNPRRKSVAAERKVKEEDYSFIYILFEHVCYPTQLALWTFWTGSSGTMSKRKVDSSSEEDTQGESAGEGITDERFFKFIDLSNNDPDMLKENRTRARSHVMRNVRRRRRREEEERGDAAVLSTNELTSILKELYSQTLSASSNSPSSRVEADITPTLLFQGQWSPLAHQILHHRRTLDICRWTCGHLADIHPVATMIIPTFLPPSSANETMTSALNVWEAVRTSPMVFHAIIAGTTIVRDSLVPPTTTSSQSSSVEALVHRGEALRLINEEVAALQRPENIAVEPSDQLLLSVLSMTAEPSESTNAAFSEAPTQAAEAPSSHPFRLPLMPVGWEKRFLSMRHNRTHHNALFTLVERCGGLQRIPNRAIAKMISNHDVLIASLDLAAPKQPYVEIDEVTQLMTDPSLNVLPEDDPDSESGGDVPRGARLRTLVDFGVNGELLRVLGELQRILVFMEAVPRGTVRNLNLLVLGSRKQALHHAILSLPERRAGGEGSLYEAVRLTALVFDVGILFPLPPCVGVLARLVRGIKDALEEVSIEEVSNDSVQALTWILFVGGIAAKGMEERRWFVQRLARLVEWMGVTRWRDVKTVLRSFVWMGMAMDDEGMEVYDEGSNLIHGVE